MNADAQQGLPASSQMTNPNLKNDKDLLNNYIYDYLIKQNLPESAKIFLKEAEITNHNSASNSNNSNSTTNNNSNNNSSSSNTSSNNNSNTNSPKTQNGPNSSNDPPTNNGIYLQILIFFFSIHIAFINLCYFSFY